jgi:hypothetical protein
MELYKIISQLTDEQYQELHTGFVNNKADKTAAFVGIIRRNPITPDKEFLNSHDGVTPAAFYVLKSRLAQKVQEFILRSVGDPNLNVMRRVMSVNDVVFTNTREISVTALRKLEKELLRLDFPYGLMIIYKELQNLHAFDDDHVYFKSRYNQQVAYSLAMDKGMEVLVQFFRSFDAYYLSRREKDHTEMIRQMEKIDNLNNLNYESHRLYIFKAVVHIFARLFIEIPDTIRCELEDMETMFEKSFAILTEYKDDTFYANIQILFNFLRYSYYEQNNIREKAKIYFEILDYKTEELLTRYHLTANTSLFLFNKLRFHLQTGTIDALVRDVDNYISQIEVDTYRLTYFVNFHMFQAYAYFVARNYKKTSKILYNLRSDINLRRHTHTDLEVKFFLALTYVLMEDFDLANQLILSLQRQLRKTSMGRYEHARTLLKILSIALGGKPRTRSKNLKSNIERWDEQNKGRFALLTHLDLRAIFLREEERA